MHKDTLCIRKRLAVADHLGPQDVVIGLSLFQTRRIEHAPLRSRLHQPVVDIELGIRGQLDDQACLAQRSTLLVLLLGGRNLLGCRSSGRGWRSNHLSGCMSGRAVAAVATRSVPTVAAPRAIAGVTIAA